MNFFQILKNRINEVEKVRKLKEITAHEMNKTHYNPLIFAHLLLK